MRHRAVANIFNRFSLSVLGVMFALGLYAILASSTMAGKMLGTMVGVICGLSLARILGWLWTRALWQKFFALTSWACILFVMSLFTASIWDWSTWFNLNGDDMEKPFLCSIVYLGVVIDCMALMRLPLRKNLDRSIRALAVSLAILGALILQAAVVSKEFQKFFEKIWDVIPWEVGAIAALIALSSHIASAIFASIEKEKSTKPSESFSGRIKVHLQCPRCGESIQLPMGHGGCPRCKLAILLECDEPRCECGYLLHQLKGDLCPECGKEVPEKSRWKSAQQATGNSSPLTAS